MVTDTTHRVGRIFADYCGYCKMMKNDWNKMTAKLHGQGIAVLNIQTDGGNDADVKIKEINDTLDPESPKLKYSTVPTIFAIHDGMLRYYTDGDRSAVALLAFANAKPASVRKHKNNHSRKLSTMSGGRFRSRQQRFRKSRHTRRFTIRPRRRRFTFAKARTEAWKYANDE